MNQSKLEKRVAVLEQKVAELHAALSKGDWRSTVGMFTGDEVMKEINEAARKIREADRRRVRRKSTSKAHVKQ